MPWLAGWFAGTWHLVFAAIVVFAFVGQLYAELAIGSGALLQPRSARCVIPLCCRSRSAATGR